MTNGSERYELPKEFADSMAATFGPEEGRRLVEALSTPGSPVSIRVNPRKRVEGELYGGMTGVPWCKDGFYLTERPSFTVNPLLHAGAFYVQEAASMIYSYVVRQIGFDKAVKAVDLCAAPGGKTGATLDSLPEGSLMVANEFVGQRARILEENMAKQGYPEMIVTNSAVEAFGRLGSTFDLMIADVPCSGEGMMRKEEVARTQWSPKLVESCRDLQRSILTDALPALKPGGWLIYSTCTFNTSEDEENVKWLMEEHGLENVPIEVNPDWGVTPSVVAGVSALRFLPHKTKGEGLFVALLRKPEDAEYIAPTVSKPKDKRKGKQPEKGKGGVLNLREAEGWVNSSAYKLTDTGDGIVRAMTEEVAEMTARLKEAGIRILSAGVEVGRQKGKELAPSTQLALSTALGSGAFPEVELDLDDALTYLRHKALRLPADTPKGYVAVTYMGLPLGFVKNIGSRANNMYPQEWRIRNK